MLFPAIKTARFVLRVLALPVAAFMLGKLAALIYNTLAIVAAIVSLGGASGLNAQELLPTPAADYNPHAGIRIITDREHTGPKVIRHDMPKSVWDASQAIMWTNATAGDLDRPTISWGVPTLLDARNPRDPSSWGLVELFWYERQPLQGGGLRYTKNFPTSVVSQWRMFLPAIKDAEGNVVKASTYAPMIDFPQTRREVDLFPRLSQINHVTLGNKYLKIGHQYIQLGPSFVVRLTPGDQCIELGPSLLVEKDGVKFLRVKHRGTLYGLRLEDLGQDRQN